MFKGIYTPSITILHEDGTFNFPAMEKHINNLIKNGINGILFFGSLGEFFAFSLNEKKQMIDFAIKAVNKRVSVMIGVGGTIMEEVIELTQYAKTSGADAAVAVSPYYFGPTDTAAEIYFGTIAEKVDIPIVLYNFPARTGNDLTPDLVYKLAMKYPNIVGIKDTVDTISHTRKLIQKIKPDRPDFSILSGFDEYYLVNRISGGDGVLCGLTNVDPLLFTTLHTAYENKDFITTQICAQKVSTLMKLYDITDLFITGIKAAVKAKGLEMSTYTKAPTVQVTNTQYQNIKNILTEAHKQQ
ncbi:4-hydroxy-tetrahydrodipicolinate synthase [Propionispira arboris]|uniref:4-hydroxy-tetrahydrodipicolinate synthase n=1 Tax=Propionispira arboris TaxID=84035 RepID=A0A1H7CV76_9FIRM|nr:dihydrodipicolinate synthase family protein [Propionispira arboris]SEJ93416.1 4-hydroxy-tetrahydrodipicolinate synthase [Propionispira arboris]